MVKLLQQILRWFFMRIENIFNVAFGDKLNPFYHLGTISFWQFWLLVGTGLYLYIFAETGINDAYQSVERITHNQWWAGGIMRSIHRYATDGMILTMLLHLLRHFAYDRYRGFRSFSWLTGVALIWLVYIAGVNGFMLVWDKLAQFVVVATAEWFDVLPMFNGTLIRNFLYLESVNSRLFTLLAFVHIGAPLIVLVCGAVPGMPLSEARKQIAEGIAAVLLEVVDISDPIEVGGQETYVITATNQGSALDHNVQITCVLEDAQEYVSSDGPTRATVEGRTIRFAPLGTLPAKQKATWRVVVKALRAGDIRFSVTMNTQELGRPVEETEATRQY